MSVIPDCKELRRLFSQCLTVEYRQVGNGASFAVRRDNTHLTVFFEKSNGLLDWRNNFRFAARPYHEMGEKWSCHRGFLSVFRAALPYLSPLVADKSVDAVTIVGYSHGAAVAFLFHEYVWFHRPDLRDSLFSYGFGCPRVLHGRLTPSLRVRWENFTVIRNIDDLVTHLPPRLFGYRHTARPFLIGEKGRYNGVDAHRPMSYLQELLWEGDEENDDKERTMKTENEQRRDHRFADQTRR